MAKLAIDVVLNKASAMTGLRGLEKDFTSFGKSMLGVVGIGGGLAGLVAGIDNILAKAGQLQDVSDAFNVSAESIQRLAAVGVTANLSIEEIGSKLGKIGKAAQEAAGGNAKLTEAFAKINIKGQELVSLNPEQLFDRLRESVSSGALAGEELTIVNELLAKDYQRFLPLLRMTSEEYTRLGGASVIMSDAMVSSLDAANVTVRQFQNQTSQVFAYVVGAFLDAAAVIKENPILLTETMAPSFEKALKDRDDKIKKSIENERKMRAGLEKNVVDQAELDREDVNAVRQKVKQIDAELAAIDKAYQMLADSEEDRRKQDLADFKQAEKEKRDLLQKRAELIPTLQELEARRAGPEAEMRLLEDRARAAAEKARSTQTPEDVTAAQQQALELQSAKESLLSQRGFGDESARFARSQTESIVGILPTSADLEKRQALEAQAAREMAASQKGFFDISGQLEQKMAEGIFGKSLAGAAFQPSFDLQQQLRENAIPKPDFMGAQLRDIPSSTEAQRTQPVRLENPPNLQGVLDKLDLLIKNAGVFS